MQIINLIYGLEYKLLSFPDGEKHVVLNEVNRKDDVAIVCRVKSSDDLFVLAQLADILNRQEVVVSKLIITYLMGMRCDRVFDYNRPFTLKIVADVINRLNAKKVYIFENHSQRSLDMIKNSIRVPETINIRDIAVLQLGKNTALAAPDKGALRYLEEDTRKFSVVCEKKRDVATGELCGFRAEEIESVQGKDLILMDDLCDGGGTFVGLAPELRKLKPKSINLVLTHAVQKYGIERVASVYDKVYISDSFNEWDEFNLPKNVFVAKCGTIIQQLLFDKFSKTR